MSRKALIIVDVQNDFIEGGSLGVAGGEKLALALSEALPAMEQDYDLIVTTQDWHIDPAGHFAENPDYIDTWPVHCVAETHGAAIRSELSKALEASTRPIVTVKKGEYHAAYSGFEGKTNDLVTLKDALRDHHIDAVDVVGIATEHCVKATAFDAVRAGFETTVLRDLVAGIDEEIVAGLFVEGFAENGVSIR